MTGFISNWLARLGIVAAAAHLPLTAAAQDRSYEADLNVGTPLVVEAPSDDGKYGVVFEDDGETGYFYALDFSQADNPIQEAAHIYNAANVSDHIIRPNCESSGRLTNAR